jgi:outer membrane protein assembly factor BamB
MNTFQSRLLCAAFLSVVILATGLIAADWSQWRGLGRDGVDHESPPLVSSLPESGLEPVWSSQNLPGANGGGWSSPVVAQGKVFLFSHGRAKDAEKDLPPLKHPPLTEKQKAAMPEAEVKEYERVRSEEDAQRRRLLRYEETVHCLDANTGELVWTNTSPSKYTQHSQSSSPAVIGDRLYLLGGGRVARCLDIENGEQLWKTRLPGEFTEECYHSSIAVTDGVAAVLAGKLFALDTASGKLLWQSEDAEARNLHSSPIVWEQNGKSWFIAAISDREVVCVEPRSGQEQWRIRADVRHSTPVLAGDRLITYGHSRKNGLKCFRISPADAELDWGHSGINDQGSSPVVHKDRVFVQGGKQLACLDLESGEPLWTAELSLNDPRYTSLVAGDDKVFYAFDGMLAFSASADSFKRHWHGKIGKEGLLAEENASRKQPAGGGPLACTSPALVAGRLYLRTASGVACYDLRHE